MAVIRKLLIFLSVTTTHAQLISVTSMNRQNVPLQNQTNELAYFAFKIDINLCFT